MSNKKTFEITKPKPISKILLEFLGNLFFVYCVIVCVALVFFSSVTLECTVNGKSMYPTLNNYHDESAKDVVFVNMYDKDIYYGNIVVVYAGNEKIVKRLVGLAGDKINIIRVNNKYVLERNGEIIEENYINYTSNSTTPAISENGMTNTYSKFQNLRETCAENFEEVDEFGIGVGAFVVPDDSIFILGDNRAVSQDSSYYGAFNMDKFVGKVEFIKKNDESSFHFYYYYVVEGKFFQTLKNCL